MVFSLVVLLAFVLVYPTLSSFLHQRAEVEALREEHAAALEHNEDLEAELRRWDDDAYVMAQARERLSFVMPGETAYRVVDPEAAPAAPDPEPGSPATVEGSTRPWYSTVWESVQQAGGTQVPAARDEADPAPTSTAPPAPTTPAP
ncbi:MULTISPECIES: FtsB family cell division protein [Cellulomonas]|uniref:FtsB family cell division protein n=1 Tax=Cellulomonas TaxID=1707 RepID=UPI001FE7C1A3|nr:MULTISPECIES: septum formation initiator family protein [Cellulomonas]